MVGLAMNVHVWCGLVAFESLFQRLETFVAKVVACIYMAWTHDGACAFALAKKTQRKLLSASASQAVSTILHPAQTAMHPPACYSSAAVQQSENYVNAWLHTFHTPAHERGGAPEGASQRLAAPVARASHPALAVARIRSAPSHVHRSSGNQRRRVRPQGL
eukprot:6182465-Pleurochrysis_carterae.AAC.1